jgi:predicted phosphodiesterase
VRRLEKWLIVPDTHAPYHDEQAWKLLLKVGRAFKPDGVAHLGDIGDFYKVSAHSKDPARRLQFDDEREITKGCRQDLDNLEPKKKKFVKGNHEHRLERYMWDKAPELDFVSVDKALKLKENGWEVTDYRDYTNVGKLRLTHDTGQGGKYTAARAAETFQASVAIGHHHAMQYFVTGDATGERKLGVSFGWLGDADKADYMHRIKARQLWSLGFGIAYRDTRTDVVHVVPIPIIDYRCMVEGKVYEA